MARIAKKTVTDSAVIFDFADGNILDCNVQELSKSIIAKLALHGISQKVGDSYASAESIQEAYASAKATWDNLLNGLWAVRIPKGGKIVEALVRATGKPFDECLTKWNDMDKDAQNALKKHPAIKKALAEIEAERAAALVEAAGDIPPLEI